MEKDKNIKELKIDEKKSKENWLAISDANINRSWATTYLRYAKKEIKIDKCLSKKELRLQQMWQNSDGSQEWKWIE